MFGREKLEWLYRYPVPAFLLFLMGFGLAYGNSLRVDPQLMTGRREVGSVWFEADSHVVYRNMIKRTSPHVRTNLHPLFILLAHPPVAGMRLLGVPPLIAVRVFILS